VGRPLALLLAVTAALAGCIQIEVGAPTDLSDSTTPAATSSRAANTPQLSIHTDPDVPRAGQTVIFELRASGLSSGDRLASARWDFGDGATATQLHPVHAFGKPSSYRVQASATTTQGATAAHAITLHVLAEGETKPGTLDTGPSLPAPTLPAPVITANVNLNRVQFSFSAPYAVDTVTWAFGDGSTSADRAPHHAYLQTGLFNVRLQVASGTATGASTTQVDILQVPFQPHVIIGIPDTGINPYHEMFYRPQLTAHPCTYIQDFPCSIPALNLTVGPSWDLTWQQRFDRDRAVWQSIREGDAYWIPQTVFVGAICEYTYAGGATDPGGLEGNLCILDDSHMHGTGTVSSALMENPDALFVFKEGGSSITPILDSGIPVDLVSVSWGGIVPLPGLGYSPTRPLFVTSAGNDPRTTLLDTKGDPDVISVGGAYAEDQSEHAYSAKHAEVVSYYCRPTAQTKSLDELRPSYCGTSFSSPTVAGALSKVILELRRDSGYTGSVVGDVLDPVSGLTKSALRSAMNRTASYDPESQYPNTNLASIPLNPVAPWAQWGWGFYDGLVANATLRHLRGEDVPDKPDAAYLYMETLFLIKTAGHPL
jgi:PKD repeat protein